MLLKGNGKEKKFTSRKTVPFATTDARRVFLLSVMRILISVDLQL